MKLLGKQIAGTGGLCLLNMPSVHPSPLSPLQMMVESDLHVPSKVLHSVICMYVFNESYNSLRIARGAPLSVQLALRVINSRNYMTTVGGLNDRIPDHDPEKEYEAVVSYYRIADESQCVSRKSSHTRTLLNHSVCSANRLY
ncbi:uncharacterized protein [Drosophila pseudoobscura]|uniref:Uncharacterized protein n=1 Tax=Drosophila pseudoobscura pseudoobscura TaxID=46245 RepID=A0A6I8W3W3_DROPS|nr:uncharacterized protein LOC26532967 [Drosophila pseudoobscura]